MPDDQIDGHAIEQWQGRFTKTFDIGMGDVEQMRLDKVVVWVVATRAGRSEFDVLDNGEVRKKTVYTVEDVTPLSGDLRDQAITFLAHGGAHGRFSLAPEAFTGEPDEEPYADEATGEVPMDAPKPEPEPEPTPEQEVAATAAEAAPEAETIGHVGEYKDHTGPAPANGGGAGPKVGKFDPAAMDAGEASIPIGEREVIGSVYPDGHKGKDKILQRAKEAIEF